LSQILASSLLFLLILSSGGQRANAEMSACELAHDPSAHVVTIDTPIQTFKPTGRAVKPARLGKAYFILTRRFGDGTFQAQIDALPKLAAQGIEILWISPVHSQTVQEMRGTVNDHGYWPDDPASIDQALGGEGKFDELVARAKEFGIEICLDIVLDHAGYTDQVSMKYQPFGLPAVDEIIKPGDPRFFRTDFIPPHLYNVLDNAKTPEEVIAVWDEISKYQWDNGLPVYNHRNEQILDWLYASYRKFIDKGVRVFRIDAAKHLPPEFLIRFMNFMSLYAGAKYGAELTFVIEFLTPRYEVLDAVSDHIRKHMLNQKTKVYFLDFPAAFKFREVIFNRDRPFTELQGFNEAREHNGHSLEFYVPMLEDHDFLTPFTTRFGSVVAHLLGGFFSLHPVAQYHGGEVGGNRTTNRPQIDAIDADGEVGKAVTAMTGFLEPLRWTPDFAATDFHYVNGDTILVSKRINGKALVLYVHRGDNPLNLDAPIAKHGENAHKLEMIYSYGEGEAAMSAKIANGRINIQSRGQVVTLFTVQYD